MKTIILAAGGTGGHLFPAISVGEELIKTNNVKTCLVTDFRCKKFLPADLKIPTYFIDIHLKINSPLNKLKSLFNLANACIRALFLVFKIKPNIVIGFGGYPSFPILLAARILRIPVIIHEQNCFIGKINRFFADYAKVIALSYPQTYNAKKFDQTKIIVTGNMVRAEICKINNNYNPYSDEFNILVLGGSQGAKIFTDIMPDVIRRLLELDNNLKINIIQLVNINDKKYLENEYDKLGVKHELAEFFHNMPEIYSKTNLVISRSGAGTITELAYLGIPAIYIPFPHATDDHQYLNAQAIVDIKGGWCYRQDNISANILSQGIYKLISDRNLLVSTSQNLRLHSKNDAAKHLSDTVLKIINIISN
ncbi:MAG: undecaprenyldiphospho-muramoylpentapeptide beta-N-acetylglucosaminyltransferase [Rickettsiales bacterium]|nr:MAG: undecaprenyldiphospho-muramoylpentapeptide beta-N-acetylglucosaminyltransferase [Rickettsiales bacterium]